MRFFIRMKLLSYEYFVKILNEKMHKNKAVREEGRSISRVAQ